MGKNSPSFVLKTVFKDISNVENVIKDSRKIKECCEKVNFKNDKEEVEKLIEDTKIIVNTLHVEVTKINDYFQENYKTWKSELNSTSLSETAPIANGVETLHSIETVVNEEDALIEKTDKAKEANAEETEKEANTEETEKEANTEEIGKEANIEETGKEANTEETEKEANTEETGKEANTAEPEKQPESASGDSDAIMTKTRRTKSKSKNKQDSNTEKAEEPQSIVEKNIGKEAKANKTEEKSKLKSKSKDDNKATDTEKDLNEKRINKQGDVGTPAEIVTTEKDKAEKTKDKDVETESTKKDENVETSSETKTEVKEEKVFLKCVDIKKLVKPDVLPRLKSPPPSKNKASLNDSVTIISDSDEDNTVNITKTQINDSIRNKRGRSKRGQLENKTNKNCSNKENLNEKSSNTTKRQTKNQKSTKDDSNVTVISGSSSDSKESNRLEKNRKNSNSTKKVESESSSDSDAKSSAKKKTERNRNKNSTKKVESESSSDSDPKSRAKKKAEHNRNKNSTKKVESESSSDSDPKSSAKKKAEHNRNKRRRPKKNLVISKTLSDTSSLSESETPSKSHKSDQKNSKKSKEEPLAKQNKKEKLILDPQSDKKFSSPAFVSLPRIPCEKLKEYYLNKKEIDEVKRLTNLDNVKRRRSGRPAEKQSLGSSSDTENVKPKPKRKRTASKNSHSSDGNMSDEASAAPNLKDTGAELTRSDSKQELSNTEMDQETVKMILDGINSGSDASESEADEAQEGGKKKSKKNDDKKSKKSTKEDEAEIDKEKEEKSETSMSDQEKKKEKSKWRKDKLLTAKLSDSDSDSEDEFIKFKKRNKKAKQDVKARICRKKAKNVIDSDSESDSEQKKKDSSGDEFKPQKKSSSSESDSENEKEEEKDPEKKKRRRIKRVKDSSSDDENKSTRKTIRRVIAHDSLAEATKQAEKDEKERKARIAERQKKYNKIFDSEKPEDATVDTLVLDFNEETKEEILAVNKDLVKKLKPHQASGVQFMWDACFESVERAKKTNGSGCILAHCMGLGKTLQVITLVHTLITNEKLTGIERVLVVCPVNTVLNWVSEFSKWLSDIEGPEIDVYDLVSSKQISERKYYVQEWTKDGGVLIIGYDMLRNLTNPNNKRLKKSEREAFQKGFVDPGPDMVVCDEGHLLKNEKSNLSIAMNRLQTIRRIVLTGTPMQNNLKEYYCMVQFVKPNLLGTYKEYLNRFVNPITNGQYTDSTQHDINIMRKRSHVLHKMLDGIVQRKDYSVLTPYLPPKYEYVLFLTLSEVQIKLYRHYLEEKSRRPVDQAKMRTTFLFMDFQEFQRICTHPRVLLLKSLEVREKGFEEDEDSEGSLKDFIDDHESDEASSTSSGSNSDSSASKQSIKSKESNKKKSRGRPGQRVTRNTAANLGIDVEEEIEDAHQSTQWWSQFCSGDELENIALGSKLYLLFEILQQCELIGDKLLVFSQSLYSLNIIEYFLAKIDEATQKGDNDKVGGFSGSWALGLDYFRLDGSSSCDNRSAWCNSFNSPDNPRARLFLISTKAGGLGINLIGANRVIIFDVSWNPSHDVQSIYRIYRFGQNKPCYIYRFVTNGTMEMKVYERQVTKQAISKRVIDEQQIDRHYNQNDLAELYNFDPKPDDQPTPLIPKDVLLAELLQKEKDRIFKYHEHQSLLENKEDEELDESERKAAWEEFENEKTARVAANASGGWIKNLPVSSITQAVVNIVQKDNPSWSREQVQSVVPLIVQQLREQVDQGEMMLFTRVVNELKLMQASHQQRLQEYYMQQQLRMMQQRLAQQQQQGNAAAPGMRYNFGNALRSALGDQTAATNSNEIVELND